MTQDELVDAMTGFFETFGATLSPAQWGQYAEALEDVNPGDLDDAMADLRKNHKFRNAPIPYEILSAAQQARRRRIVDVIDAPGIAIDPNEGELKAITLRDGTTMNVRVLPDHHPAIPKRHCIRCDDSGFVCVMRQAPIWMYGPDAPMHEYTERCHCIASNPVIQRKRQSLAVNASKFRSDE